MSDALYLRKGAIAPAPAAGDLAIILDTDGSVKTVDSNAVKSPLSGGGGAVDWRRSMFAFAQAKYPTIATDFLCEFDKGATGDYVVPLASGPAGAVNYSTVFNMGGVQLDTGAGTVDGNQVQVMPIGKPTLVGNVSTGAPWFVASHARLETTPGASGQTFPIVLTQTPSQFTFGAPALGFLGSTSTTNLSLVNGAAGILTSVVADFTAHHDYAVGFDGVTITAYYGSVLAGTLVAVATSTSLGGLHSGPGCIAALIAASGVTRQTMDVDKLYCATALA